MADKLRQFRVQNLLGKGAFGDVYKVVRISDGVTYALKKINIASMSSKEVADTLNEIR
jgi:NIMA (never in mitosis gene a)-related kinase